MCKCAIYLAPASDEKNAAAGSVDGDESSSPSPASPLDVWVFPPHVLSCQSGQSRAETNTDDGILHTKNTFNGFVFPEHNV